MGLYYIKHFKPSFRTIFHQNFDFDENFDFLPKFRFLRKISILTKIPIFDQNFADFSTQYGFVLDKTEPAELLYTIWLPELFLNDELHIILKLGNFEIREHYIYFFNEIVLVF